MVMISSDDPVADNNVAEILAYDNRPPGAVVNSEDDDVLETTSRSNKQLRNKSNGPFKPLSKTYRAG